MPDTPLPQDTRQALPPPRLRPPRPRRRLLRWLALLLLLGAAGGGAWWYWPQLTGAGGTAQEPRGRRGMAGPVPVTVAPATRKDVPITLDALGTLQAIATITVRPQVEGRLIEVAYREGQEVKAGDILARIDPRPYAATLAGAQAKKAQDEALLANARLDLQRYTTLARNEGVSRQQADTQRAQVAQLEAQVQADQAAIETAQIQLDFTTIRSPIDGRVGLRLVDPGNLIRAGDTTGIVVVTQTRPIAVIFTLPQQQLPAVLDAMARGPGGTAVAVQALATDGTVRAEGTLLTIDNQVDQATGTIRLKASFPNEDGRLWPGAFVTVRLRVDTVADALTVPLVAVQRGPEGAYAFVARPDDTVEQRPLTLGALTAGDAVVRRGLEAGERVVTSGALRLTAGQAVTVMQRDGERGEARAGEAGQGRGDGQRGPRRRRPEGAPQ
jgi:multidrug efflux system membrane fusion protein